MDLLEYQAKALFRQMEIPVLPSQRIDNPADLKGLKIPYPVVLKSQVRAGGRGRAGGIKFVENTIDAVAAAQTIFNLPIESEYPQVLLAEAKYNADQELYLAVLLDPVARRPVLLGSQQGGMDVEGSIDKMQQVVVDQEFSPFYARRLMLKMGLQGNLIQSVSTIVEKMYRLFVEKDLDLVEINPLGINPKGEVMALDGKVSANNDALGRHPDLVALGAKKQDTKLPGERRSQTERLRANSNLLHSSLELAPTSPSQISNSEPLNLVELDGNIGILCNGVGLTMATLDAVVQEGGKPANFVNLGSLDRYDSVDALRDRAELALELVSQDKSVKVVLVNILASTTTSEAIIAAVVGYLERKTRANRQLQIVLLLVGIDRDAVKKRLGQLHVQLASTLDQAVAQAVSQAK
ncbi:MAG: succinate--CoA ligase subunit beta [Tychonema bourrellyi B0820]|uniref:Succinate--CoA ligase subunit beta n=1 Tax=Tychonema bourrellyi FEM_GT703 TaxID=2040638 RepID=A0A2G4F1V5_9CYAN|nr:succinate--CoA ligase subunit beta [Tychonema bourrellyi]MDQ2099275.1 succinate--CoA ligase subunit beta [Tychonema bourrellyi B0820]PHX55729.1 succinate--CoA ligase subunit beta [Tychonema bourrellyi FEM_GT703]